MRKTSGAKHMSQRALLKARVREVSEKLGNSLLSLVLALSLVPTASIAYAVGEGDDSANPPIEERAETPEKPETPADTEEPAETPEKPADTEESSAPADKPSTNPTESATEPDADTEAPSTEPEAPELPEADVVVSETTVVTPSEVSVKVDGFSKAAVGGTVYANEAVTATLTITGKDLAPALFTVTAPEGISCSELSGDASQLTATVTVSADNEGTFDPTGIKVTYNETTVTTQVVTAPTEEEPDATEENTTKNTEVKTATVTSTATVVIDKTAPTVSAWVDSSAADSEAASVTGATQLRYLDLQNEGVTFKIKTDDSDVSTGTLTLTWVSDEDGTELESATNVKLKDGQAQVGPFAADKFVNEDGSLRRAKVTFSVTDHAGNTATTAAIEGTAISTFEFSSDSAKLDNVAEADLVIEPAEGVLKATTDEELYNGALNVSMAPESLDGIKSVEVTDGETALFSLSAEATTGEAQVSEDGSHTINVTVTTAHGCVKTFSKSFSIDSTTPELTEAKLANTDIAEQQDEGSAYYYGKDGETNEVPTFSVTIKNTSTVPDVAEALKITLSDSTALEGTWAQDGDVWTFTPSTDLSSLQNQELTASVSLTNIFGVSFASNDTEAFVVDYGTPVIAAVFSGPSKLYEQDAEKIAAFFRGTEEDDEFTPATEVGTLTITVKDPSLDKDALAISGAVESNDEATETDPWTEVEGGYQVVIPYAKQDNRMYFLTEGDNQSVHVDAKDLAGNASEYNFSALADEIVGLTDEQKKEAKEDGFIVDVSSPVIADPVITGNNTGSYAHTLGEEGTVSVKVYDEATVTVRVSDPHFSTESSYVVKTTFTNGTATTENLSEWTEDGDSYTMDVALEDQESTDNVVYRLDVYASDALGNATTRSLCYGGYLAVDHTAPVVKVVLDQDLSDASPIDGIDYYGADEVNATVMAYDASFLGDVMPSNSALNVTENAGPSSDTTAWTWKDDHYEKTYTFGQNDVDVTFDIEATLADVAGNATTYGYGPADGDNATLANKAQVEGTGFRVDNVKPEIVSVELSQEAVGAVEKTDYYAADAKLTATVTVFDMNFDTDASNSKINVTNGTWEGSEWKPGETPGQWVATLTFDETEVDKTQTFDIAVVDLAGNDASAAYKDYSPNGSENFVIDVTAPEIAVSFSEAPVGAANGIDYYAAAPKATITVTDRNFDKDNSIISPVGGKVTKSWTQEGEAWTAEVTFGENREGDYADVLASSLDVTFQDKVFTANAEAEGHNGSWAYADLDTAGADTFVVDLTQPTIKVELSEKATNNFDNKDFFGSVNGDGYVVATITVVDNNFDTASAITPTNAASYDGWATSDTKTYTAHAYFEESASIDDPSDLALDVFDMVYTAATDKSAVEADHRNTHDYRDANTVVSGASGSATGFIIDLTAPLIDSVIVNQSPTSTGADGETGGDPIQFFNVATSMTFNMSDTNGLREVSLHDPEGQYEVSKDGTNIAQGAKKGTFSIELVDGTQSSNDTEYERDIELTATDIAGNSRVWTIDRTGKVTSARSESAANRSINDAGVYPWALIKDTTAPQVSLDGPAADTFTNQTQTVTATVTEFNFHYLQRFDGSRTIMTITKQEGNAGRATTTTPVPASVFTGSASTWTNTQTFAEDGHYTVEATFKDYANNDSNVVKVGEFTIDKTAPVIESIVFDNNNVRNGRYYNAGRTATITIVEHNWDDSLAVITSNGNISGWTTNGDTHVATVSFLTDGDYNLSVSVADKAGNTAEDRAEDFTVDLTAPTIVFADVEEGTAYNDVIAPSIIYTDEKNFDLSGIEHTIVGSKHGSEFASLLERGTTPAGNSATVSFSDFVREVEYDDIYTINAHMVDLAGNEAENSITFSVNRFGSNFVILNADELKGPRDNGYLADPVEVLIEEINVSGAQTEEHGVSVTHGLDTENLELLSKAAPGSEGYYIETVNDSANWSHYTYHVYKPNFDVDGNYHVVVSSNDYATNKNNSASYYSPDEHAVADAEVSFILDTTDPIIDGLNVTPKSKENAESFDVTFTVTDNIAIDSVQVTLDGETQSVEPDLTGLCTVSVPAKSFTRRSIDILATDLAGRTAQAGSEGFRVTTNFVENYWPGMVAAGGVGAGGGWWFLAGKKRRKDEEEQA